MSQHRKTKCRPQSDRLRAAPHAVASSLDKVLPKIKLAKEKATVLLSAVQVRIMFAPPARSPPQAAQTPASAHKSSASCHRTPDGLAFLPPLVQDHPTYKTYAEPYVSRVSSSPYVTKVRQPRASLACSAK